ncbi:MAG: thermonuclease family protein [Hyphomicrobiaceae bacterium]
MPFIMVLTVGDVGVALAGDRSAGLKGPIAARVLRVIDGDTIAVRANIWLGQHIEVSVRLAGIDAPELRSQCRAARNLAHRARNHLHHLIAGTTVFLHDIRRGKYAGRVVATVRQADGSTLNQIMLDDGLAEVSPGRRKSRNGRHSGCNVTWFRPDRRARRSADRARILSTY